MLRQKKDFERFLPTICDRKNSPFETMDDVKLLLFLLLPSKPHFDVIKENLTPSDRDPVVKKYQKEKDQHLIPNNQFRSMYYYLLHRFKN